MTHDPRCPVKSERVGGAATDPSVTAVAYQPNVPCQCALIAEVRKDERAEAISDLEDLAEEMRNWSSVETQSAVKAAPGLTAGDWLWAQRGVHRSIGELRAALTSLTRTPTTCHRGCRDGLVRVLSSDGEDTEVDLCPCQR